MSKSTYLIVSDKFSAFAVNKNTITISQFQTAVQMISSTLDGQTHLIAGQGLSEEDRSWVFKHIQGDSRLHNLFNMNHFTHVPERARYELSHKKKPKNTLIGVPHECGDGTYSVDILIDENCELMEDHQTGQHVQGMVLLEAARQAFLAVTEKFFVDDGERERYFVINNMDITYHNFVFPVPATIGYRITEQDINERRSRFDVVMDIIQSGEICATCTAKFTVYPDCVIAAKEAELALKIVEATLMKPMNGGVHLVA